MKVAAIQHDIVWEDPAANFARLAPLIADAAAAGRAARRCSPRCSRPGSRWTTERIAEPVDGPSTRVPRRPGARARRLGLRVGARARAGRRRCRRTRLVLAAPDGARAPLRQDPPVHLRRRARALRRGRPTRHRRRRGRPRHACSSATTCASPTSSGRSPPTTDCYVVVANWPATRREHWRTLLRARAIENQAYVVGVNRVGDGRRARLRRRQRGHRPVRRESSREADGAGGDDAVRRRRPRRVADTRAKYPFLNDRR